MRLPGFVKPLVAILFVGGLAAAGYLTRDRWLPWLQPAKPTVSEQEPDEATAPSGKVIVSDQAQKNLGLTAKRLKADTFWKTIPVPGMVVDRPGQSDRNVVAPTTAVVTQIHRLPGDTVRPGDVLFTLKLLSDSLHLTQTDLFKAVQDIKFAEEERERLSRVSDTVAGTELIQVKNQIARLQVAVQAYREALYHRGLVPEQVDGVAKGKFVSAITIAVPPPPADAKPEPTALLTPTIGGSTRPPATFEVQELKVELGQHIEAGQTLCLLANHQKLAVEGRAFRDETPLLERSVKEGWPVDVDFQEDAAAGWDKLEQAFHIRHLANTIDPVNRTFAFLLPLENQSRIVEQDGRTQTLWRFRPGQKVRLLVRVEKVDNVFVLPADAVAHDGLDTFVFTQNVNTFERKPVRVLLRDRDRAVIANDGSLPTYSKDKDGSSPNAPKEKEVWTIPAVVHGAAAQLNRMVKAGSSGVPKGYHIHADGSLHKNEDEAK